MTTSIAPTQPSWRTRIVRQAMSLRARFVGALLFAVVLAVGAGTISHLAEVSARLEHDLGAQASRVTNAITGELEQTNAVLDEALQQAVDPRGGLARSLASGHLEARFLSAQSQLQSGRIEILKVLLGDGTILSSGHWPASFGALDPLVSTYKSENGLLPRVVDEATPEGDAPSWQRWAWARFGTRDIVVVAGRFLDGPSLERIRARTGADLLALCQGNDKGARCVSVRAPQELPDKAFALDDSDFTDHFVLQAVPLQSPGAQKAPLLVVGLDRSAIDRVRGGIVRRALAVGIASIVFAMLLGTVLATRLIRPIEALASAADKLAHGDLSARVTTERSGGGEVKDLVVAFNQMAVDLERGQTRLRQAERVAAWQEIARGLAHELKNPLTPILGAMDVLRKARKLNRPDFDDILNEQATAVVEEVMRLKELSDAFARFARLPDKKPEPTRMEHLVDNALALYAGDEALHVQRHYDPELPSVTVDRTQWGTVITNLVKNAVEAMDGKGTLGVTLHVVGEGPDAQLELVVEDSGPGISPDIQERLFTPYVTTKGSRGTGLGLALVHRIVAEHGGTIEGGKASLGGAAFTVRVPLEAPVA
jgi:signal transduction histidine kinase